MIDIDGSEGEGGGQILRTALGLSMATGQPFRLTNVRANRAKPGLMRQHLACVTAAAEICGARVDGAVVGSRSVTFTPGPVRPGEYRFAVGSAGSTLLVLQAILPPLLVAGGPSLVTVEGGTMNPFAPPAGFVEHALLPLVRRMGGVVSFAVERHGFYPAGGGRVVVTMETSRLRPIELVERGPVTGRTATAYVAGLLRTIAERELVQVGRSSGWGDDDLQVEVLSDSEGPGNAILLKLDAANVTEVFAGFGARGVTAEAVAMVAVGECERYLRAGVPVGPHLADQLLVFMALAGGGAFVTSEPTPHLTTNVQTIGQFLPTRFTVTPLGGGRHRVAVA